MIRRPLLHIDRLDIRLGARTLVTRGPMTLRGGRVYLVQGPSGAGKSSFARALLGLGELVRPTMSVRGDARLEDELTPGQSIEVWRGGAFNSSCRSLTSFLPQAGALGFIDELGVFANASFYSSLPVADAKPRMETLAARLRIWPLPRSIARASGGEKMRVSAVRALMPRNSEGAPPALLIADEPTSGIDDAAAKELARALVEAARDERTLVLIVTHEPGHFIGDNPLPPASDPRSVRLVECEVEASGVLRPIAESGSLAMLAVERGHGPLSRVGRRVISFLEDAGAFLLAPLAFLRGLVALRKPRPARIALLEALRIVFHPGTWTFVTAAALMISVTVAVFIFQLFPRRELIEPLLLEELLRGYGIVMVQILLPMFAAVFAMAKSGAAGAARLGSSVRSGLLDTLALGAMPVEGYALAPQVVGQTAGLALMTAFTCVAGIAAGALVFMAGGSPMSLDQVMAFMYAGVERYDHWRFWLILKIVTCGFLGGALTALFGVAPVESEQDVARAVHRTLLWGMITGLAAQCAYVVAEFSAD